MKTFVVEGSNWRKEIQIDENLFDKEGDMGFEAMTQAVECYFEGDVKQIDSNNNKIGLGYFLSAYDKEKEDAIQFNGQDKVMCLLEPVLVNAGYHEMAEQIRKSS